MAGVDWNACAARVGGLVSRSDLEPESLAELDAPPVGEPVGVACSGGADSVFLVLALVGCLPGLHRWQILHFDHGTRGPASRADADSVASMAAGLGLPFIEGSAVLEDHPTEAVLRRARLGFLHEQVRRLGASRLVLGHQADDVVETILIRLARGSGARGLSAPRPVQAFPSGIRHLRPLLGWSRERIHAILTAAGAPWCEDASNRSDHHLRNRLRHSVVPAWSAAETRDVMKGVLLARRKLEDEDRALDAWLAEFVPDDRFASPEIDLSNLEGRPRALWRRAIDRWVRGLPGLAEVNRNWVEELVGPAVGGAGLRVSAGASGRVELDQARLRFIPTPAPAGEEGWPEISLNPGSTVFRPSGESAGARVVVLDAALRDRIMGGRVDPAREGWLALAGPHPGGFCIRARRPGDRYRPLGSPGSIKLGDQFINRKIPMERRRHLPVFALVTGEPVWCPGLPISELFRVNEETIQAVQLTYCWSTATFRL